MALIEYAWTKGISREIELPTCTERAKFFCQVSYVLKTTSENLISELLLVQYLELFLPVLNTTTQKRANIIQGTKEIEQPQQEVEVKLFLRLHENVSTTNVN